MGAESVVREDNGAVGVRGILGGRVVRYDDNSRRATKEKTVQTRLVLHRVLRQRRFLFQGIPVQDSGKRLFKNVRNAFTHKIANNTTAGRVFRNWAYAVGI